MDSDYEIQARTIDKIIEKVGDLPSPPAILNKAIKLASDVDSKISEISNSISSDQSISAKILRMSNSPVFARIQRVSSLQEAVKTLGFNQLKSIIITASTYQMFTDCGHGKIATQLWHHSFSSAIASRIIAQNLTTLDKEEAYLAGLLHDIGKLILLKITPRVYTKLIDSLDNISRLGFLAAERKELGFDHTEFGAALLSKWNLPQNIVAAVAGHHECKLNAAISSDQLVRVIALANIVSRYIGTDFCEPYEMPFEEKFYLGRNAIEGDRLIMIQSETESVFNIELSLLYN
ncbi:MAG: HDOD domain-containing protein [Candidatus Zixiibacteriota bacterium]